METKPGLCKQHGNRDGRVRRGHDPHEIVRSIMRYGRFRRWGCWWRQKASPCRDLDFPRASLSRWDSPVCLCRAVEPFLIPGLDIVTHPGALVQAGCYGIGASPLKANTILPDLVTSRRFYRHSKIRLYFAFKIAHISMWYRIFSISRSSVRHLTQDTPWKQGIGHVSGILGRYGQMTGSSPDRPLPMRGIKAEGRRASSCRRHASGMTPPPGTAIWLPPAQCSDVFRVFLA